MLIRYAPYAAISQVPVVVSLAVAAAAEEAIPRPDATWLSLAERFGLPVVAAAASAWVAYRLAVAVIDRAWKREDLQDTRWQQQNERWEGLTERNVAALTQVQSGLNEVVASIKNCRAKG